MVAIILDFFYRHPFFVVYATAINVVALFTYGMDKLLAKTDARRVPERVLLVMALLGGSAGAILGMQLFRHKTRKVSFLILLAVVLLVQVGLAIFLFKDELNSLFSSNNSSFSAPGELPPL